MRLAIRWRPLAPVGAPTGTNHGEQCNYCDPLALTPFGFYNDKLNISGTGCGMGMTIGLRVGRLAL